MVDHPGLQMDSAGAEKGRARVRRGAEVEHHVCGLNEAMRLARVAKLRKIPTPLRVLGAMGKFLKCQREKKSGVDFMGHMLDGTGRSVYVECKSSMDWSFALVDLMPHQLEELRDAHAAKTVSLLLVVCGRERATCVIPVDHLELIIASGVASINRVQLEAHRVSGHYLAGWVAR